eukprot:TRINITY_DN66805_c0_g1_i1.p2 TRINITY_DN66805_c0_g1~~TRINITY_DN66805_c0_g1_i1.p2  ORF type:complete len:143 (-),score=29.45 TRINITY_DN66805_c0_g1_i1:40-468(-)
MQRGLVGSEMCIRDRSTQSTWDSMEWLISENTQIGIGFLAAAVGFYLLGIMMVFNQAFLIIANLAFVVGITLYKGAKEALKMITNKDLLWSLLSLGFGFLLIVFRHPFLGFGFQAVGAGLYFTKTKFDIIGAFNRIRSLLNF